MKPDIIKCCSSGRAHRRPAVDASEVVLFNPAALSVSAVSGNLIRWCVFHSNPTAVFLTSDSDPNQEEYPDAAVWTLSAETK